ncbi:MAG: type I-E CRISPR-associated protein Cse1/CasA, partial [Candidatus Sumerlaeia bacterium]|nr:type I-E CRISPR-associated protein Cse1/CasA [Candidatus Sumerlaeia bacterium]
MKLVTKLTYNLVTEPWIPITTNDGHSHSVSLRQVFEQAQEIRDISDPSPLSQVGLYRLLLAILYRTHKITTSDSWKTLWSKGWNFEAISDYLERWENRFDLFSETHPFYQRIDLPLDGRLTPLTKLSNEFTAGNNKQVFDHSTDENPVSFTPDRCARLLIEAQFWSIGGGVSG